ncbi:MAG: hypothetical protein GY950_06910 [bacterium]|nr:hypothetical protein [bacterium]
MDEQKKATTKKNPLGASVLSALCPGVGFFYLGNFVKGIAYLLVFVSLLVLATKGRGHEVPVFVLMCVGFYIFQIFDSFEETKKIGQVTDEEKRKEIQSMSLLMAVVLLLLGIIFQLESLNIISFHQVTRFWPLVLIILGGKYIYGYSQNNKEANGGQENE